MSAKKRPHPRPQRHQFNIVVGRWAGIVPFLWYADVARNSDNVSVKSFTALTKRGAVKKAHRHIRKQLPILQDAYSILYVYDENIFRLERESV